MFLFSIVFVIYIFENLALQAREPPFSCFYNCMVSEKIFMLLSTAAVVHPFVVFTWSL